MNNFTIELTKDELMVLLASVTAQLTSMENQNNSDSKSSAKAEQDFMDILDNLGRKLTAVSMQCIADNSSNHE